jgi:ankyrin repeat protein
MSFYCAFTQYVALNHASSRGLIEIIKLLHEHGANIDGSEEVKTDIE